MISKCCIFIDEDFRNRAIFTKALNDVSPETLCFTACNGLDALYMMAKENVIPKYIFIELNMPAMDGVEFLKLIKKIQVLKEVPVIVHSTSPQPQKIIELKELGAAAIYFRPYEYSGVCNMLNLYFGPSFISMQQN
jgi:CheY-like chemotaxis protein